MAEPTISLRLLETLTSALYEDPIILFREYVQNSLDAYNNETNNDKAKIMDNFGVNINIDRDRFNIEITDNGYVVIPLKSATGSDSNRPPVPTEIGHRFRSKSATLSERSDAGF